MPIPESLLTATGYPAWPTADTSSSHTKERPLVRGHSTVVKLSIAKVQARLNVWEANKSITRSREVLRLGSGVKASLRASKTGLLCTHTAGGDQAVPLKCDVLDWRAASDVAKGSNAECIWIDHVVVAEGTQIDTRATDRNRRMTQGKSVEEPWAALPSSGIHKIHPDRRQRKPGRWICDRRASGKVLECRLTGRERHDRRCNVRCPSGSHGLGLGSSKAGPVRKIDTHGLIQER